MRTYTKDVSNEQFNRVMVSTPPTYHYAPLSKYIVTLLALIYFWIESWVTLCLFLTWHLANLKRTTKKNPDLLHL